MALGRARTGIVALLATSADELAAWAASIDQVLDSIIGDVTGLIVGVYWPSRGGPDLRAWMKQVNAGSGACAFSVIVEKEQPLIFRCWAEGESLERGVWNIPIPVAGPSVDPDVTITPILGFDPQCDRLGHPFPRPDRVRWRHYVEGTRPANREPSHHQRCEF